MTLEHERSYVPAQMAEPPLDILKFSILVQQHTLQCFLVSPGLLQPESTTGRAETTDRSVTESWLVTLQSMKAWTRDVLQDVMRVMHGDRISKAILKENKESKKPKDLTSDDLDDAIRMEITLDGLSDETLNAQLYKDGLLSFEARKKRLCTQFSYHEDEFNASAEPPKVEYEEPKPATKASMPLAPKTIAARKRQAVQKKKRMKQQKNRSWKIVKDYHVQLSKVDADGLFANNSVSEGDDDGEGEGEEESVTTTAEPGAL